MNKTSAPKPPETETTDALDEKLDAPLSNRAYFLGVAYLAQAITVEGALTRGDRKEPPQEGLEIAPA
jgi:hypothetical protein